jgi:hypothetical protein
VCHWGVREKKKKRRHESMWKSKRVEHIGIMPLS